MEQKTATSKKTIDLCGVEDVAEDEPLRVEMHANAEHNDAYDPYENFFLQSFLV